MNEMPIVAKEMPLLIISYFILPIIALGWIRLQHAAQAAVTYHSISPGSHGGRGASGGGE